MTRQKQLKALVRARMAKTGESYLTARRQVLNTRPPSAYELRGGVHPETAACANAFANRGITTPSGEPISEAMVLGLGGGLGAGYILWEFSGGAHRIVTAGFRNQWQYPQKWMAKICHRLGIGAEVLETGGGRTAARQLDEALDRGVPAVVAISAADLPYWHLPAEQSGWIGYPLTVYGRDRDNRFLVDDRNTAPLTVAADDLRRARARIPSYKHRMLRADAAATEVDPAVVVAGIRSGLAEQVEHLSAPSTSFSLPAFAKWSKMLVDKRNAKGWPTVFADGRGLLGALVSTFEAVDEVGLLGGNLRRLYADFLDEAGPLTGLDLTAAAAAYREAAAAWASLASSCLASPVVADVIASDRRRRDAIRRGDRGLDEARAAAEATRQLLASDDLGIAEADRQGLFELLSGALAAATERERAALAALASALPT